MIIIRHQLFLPILVLYFLSCQPKESTNTLINEVPDSGSLVSKEISLDNAAMLPTKILVFGDKAVIFDNKKEELFKVYRLPDFSFLYSFGEIGEGPDEFNFVDANSLQILDDHLVVVYGTRITKVKLEADRAVKGETFDLLMADSSPVNRLLLVNDSTYVSDIFDAKPGAPEHQMVHLGLNKEIARFGKYPLQQTPVDPTLEDNLYRNFLNTTVVNPIDGRLAAFYLHHNQIRFYSPKGELLQEIEIEGPSKEVSEEEPTMYRVEPLATADHIYVMYVGKPKKEVEEQIETFRPHLEIWDWEGNLLHRFTLDQPLTTFAVSGKFQKLYGLSFFKEDVLFEYDLKEGLANVEAVQKKQVLAAKEKSNFAENDFYRMELPVGWNYAPMSLKEKNLLVENDGLYLNGVFFTSENPGDKSFCPETMQLTVAFPKEDDFDFDGYLQSRVDRHTSNPHLDDLNIKELDNGLKGFRVNYSERLVDPKGKEHVSYKEVDIFVKEGRIIETGFGSCTLFEHYFGEVQSAFGSLTLKDGFPK